MAAALKVDVDDAIKKLNLVQRTQIPFASKRTLQKLGKLIAKDKVPAHMKEVFKNPNNLTLKSLNFKMVGNYEVKLDFISNVPKGNAPANYLAPVTRGVKGNQAYETKFSRFVKKAGIVPSNFYPIPFKPNLSKNSHGKVSQGVYSKTWSGLQTTKGAGKTGRGFRYFSVPDNRNRRGISARQGSLFDLPKGIYRVKGRGTGGIQLLFTYAERPPTVPKIFNYYGIARTSVAKDAPGIFRDMLREALK